MSRPTGLGKHVEHFLGRGFPLSLARRLAMSKSSTEYVRRRYHEDPEFRRARIARAKRNYRKRKARSAEQFKNLKLCGLCRNRRAICEVSRLVIHKGEYEQITIPYCGQC